MRSGVERTENNVVVNRDASELDAIRAARMRRRHEEDLARRVARLENEVAELRRMLRG